MQPYSKTLSLPSSINNLVEVEAQIDQLHESGLISDAIYGNVLIATTEAFLNAVQHGNHSLPSKLVKIDFIVSKDLLEISVLDQGLGFDHNSLPDPTDPGNIEKANGRGIFIIKNLADSLISENAGSLLKMEFNLKVKELIDA